MVLISLYKIAFEAACLSLQEIAERRVAKSLFLRQEVGVWMATAEAQWAVVAHREELATSRGETAAAREDVRLATLAKQNVFTWYEAEAGAHWQAERERRHRGGGSTSAASEGLGRGEGR